MPAVIALVVVFASVLGGALVTLSSAHQVGSGLDIQGVRAYYAARAGLEWGMYHALKVGFGGCTGVNGKAVAFGGNLAGFRAQVSCQETVHDEGGTNVRMYAITSTACNDVAVCSPASPPAGYVERQLRATLAQ